MAVTAFFRVYFLTHSVIKLIAKLLDINNLLLTSVINLSCPKSLTNTVEAVLRSYKRYCNGGSVAVEIALSHGGYFRRTV